MMSLESSISLNIPSSLLVNAAPHSEERPKKITDGGTFRVIYFSVFRCDWWFELTMFQLWQHWFLSIHRGALSNQQPLGQILFVKGLKNIFSCNNNTIIYCIKKKHTGGNLTLKQMWIINITIDEPKDNHDLIQHLLQFFVCCLFVSCP